MGCEVAGGLPGAPTHRYQFKIILGQSSLPFWAGAPRRSPDDTLYMVDYGAWPGQLYGNRLGNM